MAEEGPFEETFERALELARDHLGTDNAHVERIDPATDTHEVVASVGMDAEIEAGLELEASKTYCRRTVERDTPLAISDAPEEGFADDPAYVDSGVRCYLGAPIFVDGETYGTVCFLSAGARPESFGSGERAFVELLARLFGRDLERRSHRAEMRERERRLETRERALDRVTERHDSLLSAAPDAILLVGVESGRIVQANESAAELTGYDRRHLLGMDVLGLFPESQRERHREEFHDVVGGEGTVEEFADGTRLVVERRDGTEVPVEVGATTVEVDGVRHVQAVLRDVSERRERERELSEREQALAAVKNRHDILVETAPDAILVVDAETTDVVRVNDEAAELTGRDRDRLVGTSVEAIYPPDQHDRYVAELDRLVEADGPVTEFADGTPLRVRRADGTEVPVEAAVDTVAVEDREYVQGILRDVSERRERERELQRKNRAIDEASVGVTIAEAGGDDNPLVYANEEFLATTGYDEETVLGRDCRYLQGPDTGESAVAELGAAIEEDRSVRTELLNYRADGSPFWNEVTITPVETDGEVTHYLGFQRDVTPRKRRERLVAVLNRVLRHNVRNGMNAVGGFAEVIAEEAEGQPAELAERIADRAQDLAGLSETARDLRAVVERGVERSPQSVQSAVEHAVDDAVHSEQEARRVAVEVDCESRYVPGEVDAAVAELVENALEHGDGAVSITVEAGEADDATGGAGETSDHVVLAVADDGPGLPDQERRVLERGQETQLEHGSGLGLWLVNWVVTGVGGHVEADDGGVRLHLPASDDPDGEPWTRQAAIGR
jgi:PAS domain S-box-containing protein